MKRPTMPVPTSRVGRVLSVAVGVAVTAGLALLAIDKLTGLPADAALRVERTVVTVDELNSRIQVFRTLYGVEPPKGEDAAEFRRDSAKAVALGVLLDDAARERGIVISDKAARDALTKMIESELGPDGRTRFVEMLSEAGAAEHEVLAEIKRQHSAARLLDEVTEDVAEPTDAEVRRAFDDRADELVTPERRKVRNIVVATEKEAEDVLASIRSGTEFAALVERHSLDLSTRADHGDLGFVGREQLDPAYADVAFEAAAGATFGPVETRFGWNVGEIVAISDEAPMKYADVKDELRAALMSERQLTMWREWLAERIKHADIVYADEYRPEDPEAPPMPVTPGETDLPR